MPTPDELRTAVDRYVTAINGRIPTDIAALFTEDALQADPASSPPNIGRDAIVEFFTNGIAASQGWLFEAERVHTCGTTAAVDFRIAVDLGGGSMVISGIEVFESAEDGRFTSAHAYWDDADVTFS